MTGLRQRSPLEAPSDSGSSGERPQKKERPPREKQKLSYKETRELESLPQAIEAMEEEKERLLAELSSPEFYAGRDQAKIVAANERLETLEKDLDLAYHRWDELESLSSKFRENSP